MHIKQKIFGKSKIFVTLLPADITLLLQFTINVRCDDAIAWTKRIRLVLCRWIRGHIILTKIFSHSFLRYNELRH